MENLTACRYCKQAGYLVLNVGIGDEVCEACGNWQDSILDSGYKKVGLYNATN